MEWKPPVYTPYIYHIVYHIFAIYLPYSYIYKIDSPPQSWARQIFFNIPWVRKASSPQPMNTIVLAESALSSFWGKKPVISSLFLGHVRTSLMEIDVLMMVIDGSMNSLGHWTYLHTIIELKQYSSSMKQWYNTTRYMNLLCPIAEDREQWKLLILKIKRGGRPHARIISI